MKHLVEKILPMATYYMSITAFIDQFSRFEYGTINHALCAAMRVYTKEYLTFIAQLEHEFQTSTSFTLQRLWFYAQELLQSMKILHNLAMTIRSIKTSKAAEDDEDDIEAVIEGLQKEESNEEVHISENQKGGAILNILSERLIGLSGWVPCTISAYCVNADILTWQWPQMQKDLHKTTLKGICTLFWNPQFLDISWRNQRFLQRVYGAGEKERQEGEFEGGLQWYVLGDSIYDTWRQRACVSGAHEEPDLVGWQIPQCGARMRREDCEPTRNAERNTGPKYKPRSQLEQPASKCASTSFKQPFFHAYKKWGVGRCRRQSVRKCAARDICCWLD